MHIYTHNLYIYIFVCSYIISKNLTLYLYLYIISFGKFHRYERELYFGMCSLSLSTICIFNCCASLNRDASCRPQPPGPTDGLTMFYKSFGCTQSWRAAIHIWLLWESHFPLNFMLLKGKLTLMTRPTSWSWWKSQSLTLTHKIFRNVRVSEWGLKMEHDTSQWWTIKFRFIGIPKKTEKRFQDVIADVSSIICRFPTDPYFFQVSTKCGGVSRPQWMDDAPIASEMCRS